MSASGVQCGSMSGQFVGHIGAFHCPERNFFANEINECDLRGTIRRTLEDFFGRLQTFGEPMYWTILPKLAERAGQCRTIRRTLGHIGQFFRIVFYTRFTYSDRLQRLKRAIEICYTRFTYRDRLQRFRRAIEIFCKPRGLKER